MADFDHGLHGCPRGVSHVGEDIFVGAEFMGFLGLDDEIAVVSVMQCECESIACGVIFGRRTVI